MQFTFQNAQKEIILGEVSRQLAYIFLSTNFFQGKVIGPHKGLSESPF